MVADSNAAGFAALDDMIAACRGLPGLARRSVGDVSDALRGVIAQAAASGVSPGGVAWAPTKDGHTPLRGVMGAVSVGPAGDGVDAVIADHHVFHERGTSRLPARSVLPPGMVAVLSSALLALFKARFEAATKGRK